MSSRFFLLSPANCRGRRAQQVLSPSASFPVAARLRSEEGVAIGDLCAHIQAWVITPDRGLLPAETSITSDVLVRFAKGDISLENPDYTKPLEAGAQSLAESAGDQAEFVLLGSVASQKYVEVLSAVFGARLVFPSAFVGRGDMSRGGLLLRAASSGSELEYVSVIGAARRGSRPPKLDPISRSFSH